LMWLPVFVGSWAGWEASFGVSYSWRLG
jgi:hypothetical protein